MILIRRRRNVPELPLCPELVGSAILQPDRTKHMRAGDLGRTELGRVSAWLRRAKGARVCSLETLLGVTHLKGLAADSDAGFQKQCTFASVSYQAPKTYIGGKAHHRVTSTSTEHHSPRLPQHNTPKQHFRLDSTLLVPSSPHPIIFHPASYIQRTRCRAHDH